MNKIIEMAKQAGFDPHDMSSDFTCNLDNIEAFAKLIVNECLAQVDKVDTMLDDDKEKTGVAWVGLAIAKHFGVEETLRNRSTYFGNDI